MSNQRGTNGAPDGTSAGQPGSAAAADETAAALGEEKSEGASAPALPRVFVSYSWAQQSWAVELAQRLRKDGVDVVIDVWDLVVGHDKYHYMERMVVDKTITHVLMLCDRSYTEKADQRRGGVSDETQIITKEVYSSAQQIKFVPLILECNANGEPYKPAYLSPRLHIDFSRSADDGYEQLLRHLFGKPKFHKPPLGEMPAFLSDTSPSGELRSASAVRRDEIVRLLERGELPRAVTRIRESFDLFAAAVERSRLFTRPEGKPFDEALIERVREARPERDDVLTIVDHWARNTPDHAVLPFLPDLLEQLLELCHVSPVNSYPADAFDAARFLSLEFVLNTVALLIKHRKLAAITVLASEAFIVRHPTGRERTAGLGAFAFWFNELDDRRRNRLRSDRTSLTADLLKEREHSAVPFYCLQQVDLLMFLVARFSGGRWHPRTLVYLNPYFGAFDLFLGARSPRRFGVLRALLSVQTLDEFADKFEAAFPPDQRHIQFSDRMWGGLDLTQLLALPDLFPSRFERRDR